MNPKYDPLFQPWNIGNVEIKNRFVMVPMEGTNMIKWEAVAKFNEGAVDFYRERARAGVGLFVCGAIPMVTLVGERWLYKHPEVFEPCKPVIDDIHAQGAKVFFQLSAGPGRSGPLPDMMAPFVRNKALNTLTKKFLMVNEYYISPDEGEPNVWHTQVKMRQITEKQIEHLIYAFGQSAKLCKEAGVDGVEIHAVHEGYLLDQFTMPYTNHRTDKYGGSLENRYRLPCEIVKEIKKVCGQDYPVALRFSVTSKTKGFNQGAVPGEEFVEVGRTLEEAEQAIGILREAGYDLFDCDNGTYDAWYWPHPPVYAPLNTNLPEVAHIKKFTDAPIVCAGRMQADTAAEAIANGDIDAMGIGRQLLCDGEYVKKIQDSRMDDIRPCISCHAGCLPLGSTNGNGAEFDLMNIDMGKCALNPATFREKEFAVKIAKKPKKIAVIGAGIAGVETALQAAARGHHVDLYEKSDKIGGVFIAAAAPDFKEKDKDLLKFYEHNLAKSRVNVHFNTEIKSLDSLDADEIVIATGAKPRTLNIPGAEKAITATDYLLRKQEVGQKVAVIGGGLTGCEIAYELALQGKEPVVIEMMEYLIKAKGVCAANSNMLRDLLAFHKVPAYLESGVKEIKDGSIVIETKDGTKEIPVDSVITSVGYIPGTPLAEKDKKHVHIIGDAGTVGNLLTAILAANKLVVSWDK